MVSGCLSLPSAMAYAIIFRIAQAVPTNSLSLSRRWATADFNKKYIGPVIGSIVGALVGLFLAYFLITRHKRKKEKTYFVRETSRMRRLDSSTSSVRTVKPAVVEDSKKRPQPPRLQTMARTPPLATLPRSPLGQSRTVSTCTENPSPTNSSRESSIIETSPYEVESRYDRRTPSQPEEKTPRMTQVQEPTLAEKSTYSGRPPRESYVVGEAF